MSRKSVLIALMLGIVMVAARISFAADPLEVAPDKYTLQFENDKVRVMQVTIKPGENIPEHSHPDHFVYCLEGGTVQITKADGTVSTVDVKVGDIVWINAETHSAVNTGTTTVRLLVTELKGQYTKTEPAATAAMPETK